MGYGTDNIIENLGSMFFYLIGFFVLAAFVLVIRLLRNKYQW
jgi:hypothetical protein